MPKTKTPKAPPPTKPYKVLHRLARDNGRTFVQRGATIDLTAAEARPLLVKRRIEPLPEVPEAEEDSHGTDN